MKILNEKMVRFNCFFSVLLFPSLLFSVHCGSEFDEPVSPARLATSLPSSFMPIGIVAAAQEQESGHRLRALSVCSMEMEEDLSADQEPESFASEEDQGEWFTMDKQQLLEPVSFSVQLSRSIINKDFILTHNGKKNLLKSEKVFCRDNNIQSSVQEIECAGAQFNKIPACLLQSAYSFLHRAMESYQKGSSVIRESNLELYTRFTDLKLIDSQTGKLNDAAYLLGLFCGTQGLSKKFGSYIRKSSDSLTISYDQQGNPTVIINKTAEQDVSFVLQSPSLPPHSFEYPE